MRLHRLVLTNYRGISHRTIEFPATGVTVVSGPNEIGKSSMIEAIDLLLESKDRSSKKDVKQVKPTHADVGSEVLAEISTGPYRFVYRKRFHKKCETELTILEPRREQLTGDEAHDRVRRMLADTVDTGLWQAQRVLQATSTTAVDLSACDALSRALDVAATNSAESESAVGLSTTEPVLIEKIDAEFARYFTATGRPTGEWATATGALKKADEDVAGCVVAVAEVDDRVARHDSLTEELAALGGQRAGVAERLSAAERVAAGVAVLVEEHRIAHAQASTANAELNAAAAAHRERLRLRSEVTGRATTLAEAVTAATQATESESVGHDVVAAADDAAREAAEGLQKVRVRVGGLRTELAHSTAAVEAHRIAEQLERITGTQTELDAVGGRLRAITLTERAFRMIDTAAKAVDIARAQAELAATTAQLTAESAVEVVIGDRTVALEPGETVEVSVIATTTIRLPGLLTTTLRPDAAALESQAKLVAAQDHLNELLIGSGIEDLDEAQRLDHERRELLSHRDQLTERLGGVLGADDPARLRSRLAELRSAHTGAGPTADPAQLQAELEAAQAEYDAAEAHSAAQQKVAAAAVAQLSERSTAAAVLRDKVVGARAELATVEDRLQRLRVELADDDLAVRAEQTAQSAHTAGIAFNALSTRLAEAGADTVTAELAAAQAADSELDGRYRVAEQALRNEGVALEVIGTQGLAGKLDAARIRREHAAAEYARVQGRASAAMMLRTVMARHRDDTRRRYVEPFRSEVERLGRTVFGPTFEVEVDSDLQIRSRTLDGRTVPFDSLSGGAKEQLGIVARLAVAALVAKDDTVPVMIDDALGFTDSGRLARMGAVFDMIGADGQVIVLTCSPERYDSIAHAHRVQLSA